jgi:hypothetical protein
MRKQSTFRMFFKENTMSRNKAVNWILAIIFAVVSFLPFATPVKAQDNEVMPAAEPNMVTTIVDWGLKEIDPITNEKVTKVNVTFNTKPDQMINVKAFIAETKIHDQSYDSNHNDTGLIFHPESGMPTSIEVRPEIEGKIRSSHDTRIYPNGGPSFKIIVYSTQVWVEVGNNTGGSIYTEHVGEAGGYHHVMNNTTVGTNYQGLSGEVKVYLDQYSTEPFATFKWDWKPVKLYFPPLTKAIGNWIAVPMLIENGIGLQGIEGSFSHGDILTYNSWSTQDGVASNWFASVTPDHANHTVKFQINAIDGIGITNGGSLLMWFFFSSSGKYGDKTNITLDEDRLLFYPSRLARAESGEVIFGSDRMTGQVKEKSGNFLPETQFKLDGPGWGMDAPVNLDGTFEIPLTPEGTFNLKFYLNNELLRKISIGEVQASMWCNTGWTTCDPISSNTYPEDGPGHVGDTICIIHYWLGMPRTDCEVGYWVFDNPTSFDNYSEGLLGVQVTGRYMGHIYDTSAEATMATTITPTISFGAEKTLPNGQHVISLIIKGEGRMALGLVLRGAVADVDARKDVVPWENNAVIYNDLGIGDEVIYLRPTASHVEVDLHYDFEVVETAAQADIVGASPKISIFLPAMSR